MHSMRSRLMAYSRGLPASRELRRRFGAVESLEGLSSIRVWHENAAHPEEEMTTPPITADASLG